MTFHDIRYTYAINIPVDKVGIFLAKAIPSLVITARAETAVYFDTNKPETLDKECIVKYLATVKEYDAIDIGRIVTYYKEYKDGINRATSNG